MISIGLFCLGYVLFHVPFAELNIRLSFFNFPIFVGEILLGICLITFIIKYKIQGVKLNRWHYLLIAYFIFIVTKALYGYVQWGPLALRHAALLYYPLFIVFGYSFYRRDFFDKLKILMLFTIIVFLFIDQKFHAYWALSFFFLGWILIKSYPNLKMKYLMMMVLLLIAPYHLFFYSARTIIVSNVVVGIFLITTFYIILPFSQKIKIILALGGIFLIIGLSTFLGLNRIKSIISVDKIFTIMKHYDEKVKFEIDNFKFKKRKKVKVYNPQPSIPKSEVKREVVIVKSETKISVPIESGHINFQVHALEKRSGDSPLWDKKVNYKLPVGEGELIIEGRAPLLGASEKDNEVKFPEIQLYEKNLSQLLAGLQDIQNIPMEEGNITLQIPIDEGLIIIEIPNKKGYVLMNSSDSSYQFALEPVPVIRDNPIGLPLDKDEIAKLLNVRVDMARILMKEGIVTLNIPTSDGTAQIQIPSREDFTMIGVPDGTRIKGESYHVSVGFTNAVFRLLIWRDMLQEMAQKKPILGFDFGKPFRSISLEILDWGRGHWKRDGWVAAHNSYLEILYRTGIVGLLFILAIFIVLLKMIGKFIALRSIIGLLLCAIIIEWFVAANFLLIFELPYSAIPVWSLYGLTFAYYRKSELVNCDAFR